MMAFGARQRREGLPRKLSGLWEVPGPTIARSKKRAENGRYFLHDDAQAQIALAQFGVQFVIRAFAAFQNVAHVGLVLGETSRVRMARVAPVPEQAFTESRHAPEQSPILELGVFFQLD